jgi:hypothetical protein
MQLMKPSELLAKPEAWTKGTFALDNIGESCWPGASQACAWCLSGALMRCQVSPADWLIIAKKILRMQQSILSEQEIEKNMVYVIARWNDHWATHEDVLALLKECGL